MKAIAISVSVLLALALFAGSADAQTYTITSSLKTGTAGTPVVGALVTANGVIPTLGTTYAITAGNLPTGVTLSAQGVFTGTPTKAETANFTVQATVPAMTIPPQTAGTATANLSITIQAGAPALTITTTTLPDGRVGDVYSAAVVAQGGTPPYGFVTNPLNLPNGVTLDPTKGTLSGTPTAAGSFNFTVYVTDSTLPLPKTANQAFSVTITAGPQLIAAGTTEWTVDRPGFSLTVSASGGDGTFTFDAPTGVPAGLTPTILVDSVTLTGTPTALGDSTFSVTVRDGTGATATLETAIHINPPVAITADELPDATAGAAYGGVVPAEDGAPPYSFRVVSKSESWIGIESGTGTLTGTPGAAGSVTFTVEVTDASGGTDQQEFTIGVNDAPLLNSTDLPFGVVGSACSMPLAATGGTAPFEYSVAAGELMDRLSFADAAIAGTPTAPGSSNLTLQVTDRWGATATADFRLTVGRKVAATGKLPPSTLDPEAREALVFDLLAGTTFDVSFKVKPGTSGFFASLFTIDGAAVDTAAWVKLGKKSLKIRKFPVASTGRYVLLLENTNGSTAIQWSGKVKAKPAKKLKHQQSFGPLTGEVEIPFSALKGASLTLSAKVSGKSVPAAELVEIVDATGRPLDARAWLVTKGTGFKISKLPIPASGDYRIRIRPDGSGSADGVLKVQLKVKSPRIYAYSADD
ncbi:MAG: putative Ig domain-containing protein [Planctomycetota bacterium]